MEKQHLHHLRACWECRFPGTTPELWDQNLHLSKLSRWLVGIVMFQNHQVSKPVSASWKGNTIAFQPFIKHPLYARQIKVGNLRSLSLRSREGNGTPLQYSCLENPMDGGAWWAGVHGVAKSWTRLSDFTFTFHFHALEKEMATHPSVLAWRIPGTGEPWWAAVYGVA